MSGNQPHEPAEKPFTPWPISHPILPGGSSGEDPLRDVPRDRSRDRDSVHPHQPEQQPLEDKP
ncbi:MAG TPA: hypothetical protein VFE52_03250 [Devosia sp.]|jgi:hypothetical protein|nr:hypothetical protein [Devosia sp.]